MFNEPTGKQSRKSVVIFLVSNYSASCFNHQFLPAELVFFASNQEMAGAFSVLLLSIRALGCLAGVKKGGLNTGRCAPDRLSQGRAAGRPRRVGAATLDHPSTSQWPWPVPLRR